MCKPSPKTLEALEAELGERGFHAFLRLACCTGCLFREAMAAPRRHPHFVVAGQQDADADGWAWVDLLYSGYDSADTDALRAVGSLLCYHLWELGYTHAWNGDPGRPVRVRVATTEKAALHSAA